MIRIEPVQVITIKPGSGTFDDARDEHIAFKDNAKVIMFAASHIEKNLAIGIAKYFFGDDIDKRNEIENMLISTSFCSFGDKRRIFLDIIKRQGLITGTDIPKYEKLLSDVIRYRNIVAHGSVYYSGKECIIKYYEGNNKELKIDDELLIKIKNILDAAFSETENYMMSISQMA